MGMVSSHSSAGATAPGKTALCDEDLSRLRNDFAQLDAVSPELSESVIRYVIDGDGPEILGRLAAMPGCGRALGLAFCVDWHNPGGNRTDRATFFKNPPAADPPLFLRLAEVYDAAARPDRLASLMCYSLGLPDWIELFLWEATNSSPGTFTTFEQKCPFKAAVLERMIAAAGEPADLLTRAAVFADHK
jgi:hypothetical protein